MTMVTKEENLMVSNVWEDEDDYVMTPEEFGEYLKNMRESMNLQQIEFALLLGLNKNTYNAYEQKKRIPKNWEGLQLKISSIAKEYHSKKRGENFSILNDERQKMILELHNEGFNIVQIGFKVNVSENEVEEFLKSVGETPIQFKVWTSKADEDAELYLEDDFEEE